MGLDLQPDGLTAGLAWHCQPDKKWHPKYSLRHWTGLLRWSQTCPYPTFCTFDDSCAALTILNW